MPNDQMLAARSLSEMTELEREHVLEALIFSSKDPISKKDLEKMFGSSEEVTKIIKKLKTFYDRRGIQLFYVGDSVAFRTAIGIRQLINFPIIENRKLSKAALETLTIIAYYQPVTRLDIEKIRGVSISKGTLDILIDEKWVSLGTRKRAPGKPGTFITTETFLDHFGLASIKDLPGIDELKEAGFGNIELPLIK